MGYSTNAIASEVLTALFDNCLTPKLYKGQKMSNTWVTPKGEFFYETTRKDQPDGGICGSIFSMTGQRKGTLKITGKGEIINFPTTTFEQRQRAQSIGMAKFVKTYGAGQAEQEGLADALLRKLGGSEVMA